MPGDDIQHLKRAMRAELRERRRTRTSTERERSATGLTEQLRRLVTGLDAHSVSAYLSGPNEPDTRPFVNWARTTGVRTLLPVSRQDGLLDWTTGDGESEEERIAGFPEAVGELLGPIAVNSVNLMIVPAASVDSRGMRLGWGRGYFDKTLGSMEHRPPVFAVLFDDELVSEVPAERHDEAVDGAVTPTRIVPLSRRAQNFAVNAQAAMND